MEPLAALPHGHLDGRPVRAGLVEKLFLKLVLLSV
jgi:hypothetical protein